MACTGATVDLITLLERKKYDACSGRALEWGEGEGEGEG